MEKLKNLHIATQLALFIQLTYWINLIIFIILLIHYSIDSNSDDFFVILQISFCCLNPLIGFFVSISSILVEKNKKLPIICFILNVGLGLLFCIFYIAINLIFPPGLFYID